MLSLGAAPAAQFLVLGFFKQASRGPDRADDQKRRIKNPRAAVLRPSRGGGYWLGQMVCANAISRALRHLMQ